MSTAYKLSAGTMTKNKYNLYFGDNSSDYGLGGFITDDYIDLNNKNTIVFNGSWTGSGNEGDVGDNRAFDVVLINESGGVSKVYHQVKASGTGDISVNISSYNDKYKVAFFCYSGVTTANKEMATVYLVKFS